MRREVGIVAEKSGSGSGTICDVGGGMPAGVDSALVVPSNM